MSRIMNEKEKFRVDILEINAEKQIEVVWAWSLEGL